ncbi:DUF4747 family protein [Nitrospirillum sp. BR 11752]|uniref:DUF4747 family protein n=1 Tax=Nitrospirillum sp. BR 11752 TaxID=3104293 RepID=UPI002ECECC11|nr:DUF4747 family protein [Nitrospirillum sp. BR 11752]
MARHKRIVVAGVNVRLHPHSSQLYVDLFFRAFQLKRPIRIRGDQHLLLSSLRYSDSSNVITGSVARFTEIDMNQPWFDSENLEKADDGDVRSINIPPFMKPNYVSFDFMFFVDGHIFAFEKEGGDRPISPYSVEKFLDILFHDDEIIKDFGHVSVDVIGDKEGLSKIFSIYNIRSLVIEIQRPNADDLDLDEEIEELLDSQNAKKLILDYSAVPGKSFTPAESTKKIAEVALRNGKVQARGRDESGNLVEMSSKDIPMIVSGRYDPKLTLARAAFWNVAEKFMVSLRRL